MKEKKGQQDKEFLGSLVKGQSVVSAMRKLNREPLPVSVYRHASLVEKLKQDLAQIPDIVKEVKDKNKLQEIEQYRQKAEAQLREEEKDQIVGVLTKLTYRDINDIKAAVTEAVVHFSEYKFDLEITMARVIAEERYMTVFCALKDSKDVSKKYFKSLEEISEVEDSTIFELYKLWEKHFVLTDEEIKN